MFRKIRRQDRALTDAEAAAILADADWGVLSVLGDDGYPYGVPVNYAYVDGKIYFHSTEHDSHKLDAIRQHSKVCFTVVAKHELVMQEYSTNYASAVVFGTARVLDDAAASAAAMQKLVSTLSAGAVLPPCTASGYVMVEIAPAHITGKARR